MINNLHSHVCRIAGIFNPASANLTGDITVMRDSMQHGGPDGKGIYVDDKLPLAIGHRRLSLLDLSNAGHQPMSDLEGCLQIVFNGEIYNFQELKEELNLLGHFFKTTCDTEVILKAYKQWGTECFCRFNGMFALAIFDRKAAHLILARDHAGIKPLYYSIDGGRLFFASEVRAFKAVRPGWPENEKWKIHFLTFGYLPEPITTLQNVISLKKGTFLKIGLPDLAVNEHRFSSFVFNSTIKTLPEAVKAIKDKLTSAVERHLISDAPIGLFLSGGIDSSLLTLLATKTLRNNLHTLSIVFEDEKFSEAKYQKLIIDKTGAKHSSFLIKEEEFASSLPDILQAMDQPSIDGINSYFICKYAHLSGLKAVLSGIGADELFGGYDFYGRTNKVRLLSMLPSAVFGMAENFTVFKNKKLAFLRRKNILGEYLLNRGLYTPEQTASILNCSVAHVNNEISKVYVPDASFIKDKKDQHSWGDQNIYMQSQLLKDVDYMGMWHGLEVRVPFLDKELMDTVHSIAPSLKFDPTIKKHLLIKAFHDVLPAEIYGRKKQGFTFPLEKWIVPVQTTLQRNVPFTKKLKQLKSGQIQWVHYWGYLLTCHSSHIRYYEKQVKKILFLNLSAFFFTGGIEKFN
ncbi:MAG TPA: asparagine synthase (glutamine-hydrolyzing), partial [Segetibacter sp.]